MVNVELRAVTQPVGWIRILSAFLVCTTFSLAASAQSHTSTYWGWCMFTWIFCFFLTLSIVLLELSTINTKLPFSWEDFTSAFAVLAALMCVTTAIFYSAFYAASNGPRPIGVAVLSWLCFVTYAAEVAITRLRPSGETSGFLSTPPGIMKLLETFFACIIFISLETHQYNSPGGRWCVSVYSLCFILVVLIIVLTVAKLTSYFPFSFDVLVIGYNILAAAMYITAMVMWPLYTLQGGVHDICHERVCTKDKLVAVTVMTILNCIVYILDVAYSILLVFCFGNNQNNVPS